jgi:polar amino acid transport system substrate-binding protein
VRAFLLALIFLLSLIAVPAFAVDAPKESAYDRVMRTGTIRCGYWDWEPVFHIDATTHQMSGIFRQVTDEIARISGLKVEWNSEVQFAQLVTDLNSGKIDAVCAGVWPSAARAKYIRFSDAVFFIPMNAYKRANDPRFDGKPDDINQPSVTTVAIDGEMSANIHDSDFPRARLLSMPQLAGSGAELLMNVATGKGDVTFTDAVQGGQFMAANPDKVKAVNFDTPLRMMPNAIAVGGGEEHLQYFFNESLRELQHSGVIEKILASYDKQYPGVLIRVARPYGPAK